MMIKHGGGNRSELLRDEPVLMLSALQHCAYCPRQFALIHVEQVWADNRFTAEGNILHERVDSGVAEQRKGTRYERSVMVAPFALQRAGMVRSKPEKGKLTFC